MVNAEFLHKAEILFFTNASFINYGKDFRMQTVLRRMYFILTLKQDSYIKAGTQPLLKAVL